MQLTSIYESVVWIDESLIDEAYPTNWDADHFAKLNSFAARVRYADENLKYLGAGTARRVYQIDDKSVLKLAKNTKGLQQNKVEIEHSNDYVAAETVAEIFNYDPNNLWVEMELATKVTESIFHKLTGIKFAQFVKFMRNEYNRRRGHKSSPYNKVPKEVEEEIYENEITYSIYSYMVDFDLPAGDLTRLSSLGVVKRNGKRHIVVIDYGLTDEVYTSYYN